MFRLGYAVTRCISATKSTQSHVMDLRHGVPRANGVAQPSLYRQSLLRSRTFGTVELGCTATPIPRRTHLHVMDLRFRRSHVWRRRPSSKTSPCQWCGAAEFGTTSFHLGPHGSSSHVFELGYAAPLARGTPWCSSEGAQRLGPSGIRLKPHRWHGV